MPTIIAKMTNGLGLATGLPAKPGRAGVAAVLMVSTVLAGMPGGADARWAIFRPRQPDRLIDSPQAPTSVAPAKNVTADAAAAAPAPVTDFAAPAPLVAASSGAALLFSPPAQPAAAPSATVADLAAPTPVVSNSPAAAPAAAAPVPAPATPVAIRTLSVTGAERLEAETVLSYINLRAGQPYTDAAADEALKQLYATELFSDVQIRNDNGNVLIAVKENPIVNRIILEGNKHIKEDKITPEIKLSARQVFTRSKVRADVNRIIELYKRQGRFGASVEPKMVLLDQNRVDVVFEISEGPKSKVRKINILGNVAFNENQLRAVMVTHEAKPLHIFTGGTSYDPDKLAYDQQKLRQFYLTQGYADFRVVSAVAELTPDKKDFIITYVVEEGKRYHFGDVKVESQLRDIDSNKLTNGLPMRPGEWYNAKEVEDTIDKLNETAGSYGYAFADARPNYQPDRKNLTMAVTFNIAEQPRVYVERIDVNGNTLTQDKVVRREFRLAEGDAFNAQQIKRSTDRIKSLGYFQEKFEVAQKPGSSKDRVVLEANVEEKPTGELQLSAGYSSLESFIFQASIQQRNFRGRGQTVGLSGSVSRYSKSIDLGFTEPYLFDKNISAGIDLYRRDYNNFNYLNTSNSLYSNSTTGLQLRLGVALSEYVALVGRYTLNYDKVTLNQGQYYQNGQCSTILAGYYLCDAVGNRLSSILGGSLIYDNLDNRQHPSKGRVASVGVDFAGLGGDVDYLRVRGNAAQYWPLGKGFIFSVAGEGGIIKPLRSRGIANEDDIFLTDRFYLGEPQIAGFDIRGVGPRIVRKPQISAASGSTPALYSTDKSTWTDTALGGNYYYFAHTELEIPLGSGAKELGIRPSIFANIGAVWGVTHPVTQTQAGSNYTEITGVDSQCRVTTTTTVPNAVLSPVPASLKCLLTNGATSINNQQVSGPFQEYFYGDTALPRISVGVGFNWNSPFGPFRIDIAKALVHAKGDDTKLFTFNVGTQF